MKQLKTANVGDHITKRQPIIAQSLLRVMALSSRAAEVTIRWPLTLTFWLSCLKLESLRSKYTILFVEILSHGIGI